MSFKRPFSLLTGTHRPQRAHLGPPYASRVLYNGQSTGIGLIQYKKRPQVASTPTSSSLQQSSSPVSLTLRQLMTPATPSNSTYNTQHGIQHISTQILTNTHSMRSRISPEGRKQCSADSGFQAFSSSKMRRNSGIHPSSEGRSGILKLARRALGALRKSTIVDFLSRTKVPLEP